MRLPSKDSAVASSLRVLGYTIGALIVAWIADPNTVSAISEYYPGLGQIILTVTPLLALLVNFLRRDVKNY